MTDLSCNSIEQPKLPKTGVDGQQICDKYGHRWEYDTEQKRWLIKGTIHTIPIVTEEQDGLATPEIYQKIVDLRQYVANGNNISPFKLLPGKDAYWYYFRSSDKLFRFRQESADCLRIEIDRGRIYQILLKEICPGKKGPQGPRGKKGKTGRSGGAELCYEPIYVTNNRIDFTIFTPTPLTAIGPVFLPNGTIPDISVRLYQVQTQTQSQKTNDQLSSLAIRFKTSDNITKSKFENTRKRLIERSIGAIKHSEICSGDLNKVLLLSSDQVVSTDPSVTILINPVDTNKISISHTGLAIDEEKTKNSIKFDPETNLVCGSIYLLNTTWDNNWCIKSMQRGPDGLPGDDGVCTIKVVECMVDDTNILATCPIVNVRPDCESEILYTMCADLIDEFCADKIRLIANSVVLTNINALQNRFAAVEITLNECKWIDSYKPELIELTEFETPELDFAHWEPQDGCTKRRNYERHNFNWVPLTDVAVDCNSNSLSAQLTPANKKYPYDIIIAPSPIDDGDCQDEFFYCPNVQEGACEPQTPQAPAPTPQAPTPPSQNSAAGT